MLDFHTEGTHKPAQLALACRRLSRAAPETGGQRRRLCIQVVVVRPPQGQALQGLKAGQAPTRHRCTVPGAFDQFQATDNLEELLRRGLRLKTKATLRGTWGSSWWQLPDNRGFGAKSSSVY